jgi:hypothetical protein
MRGDELKFMVSLLSVTVTAIVSIYISWRQSRNAKELADKNIDSSRLIAEKQINATVLSGNRQEWINTLRNQISEMLSIISLLEKDWHLFEESGINKFMVKRERLFHIQEKISLLLNPIENDHSQLIHLIDDAIAPLCDSKADDIPQKMKESRMVIRSKSQEILKREWERVKKGV